MAIQSDAYDLILCQVHPLAVKQTKHTKIIGKAKGYVA